VQFLDSPTQKALEQFAERMRKTCDAVARLLDVSPYVKKQKAHVAYCSAREETRSARVCLTYREQLRDLFAVFVTAKENAPPLLARCSVLSLCSASNAPSVARVHTTMQVTRE
jgi:hypothetical protein